MAKFVYVYTGGLMAETPEAQAEAMAKWGAWFESIGDVVSDVGNPFGASTVVTGNGASGTAPAGGYSIVTAGSLDEAATNAKGCPVLETDGTVQVYEAIEM